MPSYKTAFGSYMKTEDLEGRTMRVIVESIGIEAVGTDEKGKEDKLVAHFAGKNKTLVLNKTKCEAITAITGTDDYEQWVGAAFMLVPGTTKYGGKTVGCIDVVGLPAARRSASAQVELPSIDINEPLAEPITADDIPFSWVLPLVVTGLGHLALLT